MARTDMTAVLAPRGRAFRAIRRVGLRCLLFLGLAVGLLASSPDARAEFHSLDVTAFRAQVQSIHDSLVPPLTAAQKREKQFLAKVLTVIDKESPSMYEDLKRIAKVAKYLNKVDDLPPELRTELRGAVDYAVQYMQDLLESLQSRVDALPDSATKVKLQKKLGRSRDALADASAVESLGALAAALADVRAGIQKNVVAVRKAEDAAGL